jgi:hypothetical protein
MLTISDRSRRKKKESPASLRISAHTGKGSSIILSSRLYSEIADTESSVEPYTTCTVLNQ